MSTIAPSRPIECVVLCWSGDSSAMWACQRLSARGRLGRVDLVLLDDLADQRVEWEQRLGDGPPQVAIRLCDGRVLDSRSIRAVLNRAVVAPLGAVCNAHPQDRTYACAELAAFALSWLTALSSRLVNTPTAAGLSGAWHHAAAWRLLASQAGLATVPWVADSSSLAQYLVPDDTDEDMVVLVVGGDTNAGSAPPKVHAGLTEMASLAGLQVMGVRFRGSRPKANGWEVLDASPYPDLTLGGEWAVAQLESVLG